VLKINYTQVNY